jgi:hypothetical protein
MQSAIAIGVLLVVIGLPLLALRISPAKIKRAFAEPETLDDHAANIAQRVESDPSYTPYS